MRKGDTMDLKTTDHHRLYSMVKCEEGMCTHTVTTMLTAVRAIDDGAHEGSAVG